MESPTTIDTTKLDAFVTRAIGDVASAYAGMMVSLGHKLGLYKALAGAGPLSAAELAARTVFERADATHYPDLQYGLICFFDCLHDLGDPEAAARQAARTLAPGGTVLLVEPFAHDRTEDKFNLVGRLYCAGSTTICCAHAIADGGHLVLGAQAGEARLSELFRRAGFTHFRRAAETPFNLIFEIRR